VYRIDRDANRVVPLHQRSFADLRMNERNHLQEWIARCPSLVGEELLILQKEFAGFSDTNERLDLLALDKSGALVVIENKLDDSGRDVTWQALKYASYCSGLSKENVKQIYQNYLDKFEPGSKAEDNLSDFLQAEDFQDTVINRSYTQRIILIAANFRKEVTSTVMWLRNYKVRLQCFRVTPYAMGDELFLDVEQIIPTRDTEEFMIGLADKVQDEIEGATTEKERHVARRGFWTRLLQEMAPRSKLFQNISPGTASWIGTSSGLKGVGLNFHVSKYEGRAEIYIDRGTRTENEFIFDNLFAKRDSLEDTFGGPLVWERLEGRRACRIKSEIEGSVFDQDQWPKMIDFMIDAMVRMDRTFRGPLGHIGQELKLKIFSEPDLPSAS
jgi:hypothetical protein